MNCVPQQTLFGIVGNDLRQAALATELHKLGYPVFLFSTQDAPSFLPSCLLRQDPELLKTCGVVVLPMPLSSLAETDFVTLLSLCHKDALLFAGKVLPQHQKIADSMHHTLIDYAKNDTLSLLNAVPTAEGAVEIALSNTLTTLWNSSCLVLGFGKCAKSLAFLLKGFGAKITVAARNPEQLALAQTFGFDTVPLSQKNDIILKQDIIFNTIPAPVLEKDALLLCRPNCLIIDLASTPGGTDFDTAKELSIKAIHALALPGKTAPLTAGHFVCQTILQEISLLKNHNND